MRQVIRRQWTLMLAACMATLLGVVLMGCSSSGNQPSSVDSVDSQVQTSQVGDPEVATDETDKAQEQNNDGEDAGSEQPAPEPAAAGVTIDNFSFTLDENNICTATATVTNHDSYMHNVVLLDDLKVLAERTDSYGDVVEEEYSVGQIMILDGSVGEQAAKKIAFCAEISVPYIYNLQENESREIKMVLVPGWDDDVFDEHGNPINANPTTSIISAICTPVVGEVLSPSQYSLNTVIEGDPPYVSATITNLTEEKWEETFVYYVQLDAEGDIAAANPSNPSPVVDWLIVDHLKPNDSADGTGSFLVEDATQIAVLKVEYRPGN